MSKIFKIYLTMALGLIGAIVLTFIIINLTQLQKENNYKRCLSVVNMAIKTGKILNKDVHEECKYHLEV